MRCVVVSHEEVGHGEQRRVHNSGRPREDDDAQFAARRCHADHPDCVHQLTAHINRFSPVLIQKKTPQIAIELNQYLNFDGFYLK